MGWKRRALDAAHHLGAFRAVASVFGSRRLTVLTYHRIAEMGDAGSIGFVGNVSATPAEFHDQMRWVADRFAVVALDDVAAAAAGGHLPRRPLLITFDDGYRDNLDVAGPILDGLGLPATLFVATDLVGNRIPPWWDLAAWCFAASGVREADLPLVGPRRWTDPHREAVSWIKTAKGLPDAALREGVDSLPRVLDVSVDDAPFRHLMLDWEDVATMAAKGWAIGAHTRSHPILTKLAPDRIAGEVEGSRALVAEAAGAKPRAFAYPNGQQTDFDAVVKSAVAAAGFEVAFTLVPGPSRRSEYTSDPLAIRRVYVHHGDGVSRFAAKAGGVARFVGAVR